MARDQTNAENHAARIQAKELVYRQIRQRIIGLEFAAGVPLRESQLAERFGVSKTPVREALVRLEREGLVELLQYRGARVRGYSPRDVREIYDMRELLEGFCCRVAATHISDGDERLLRRNVVRSRELLSGSDVDAMAAAFDEFDEIIYRQAAHHRIASSIDELAAHLERLGRMTVKIPGRLETSVEQHEAILLAIQKRDGDTAEHACRAHIRSVLADLMDEIELNWTYDPETD